MTFKSLGLSQEIIKAVEKKGYTNPSPIQEKAIPLVLKGRDILASAQTGTGKTAGFTLPILHLLSQAQPERKRKIRALVLTPTRELAAQVYDNVKAYSTFLDFRSTVIFGGVNQNPQVRTIKNGIDLLVATPGRLLDLHDQKTLSLAHVDILVLDEADRMLDMGFIHDIKKVTQLMPEKRQNLMFSATFSKDIKKLATSILNDPVSVEATPENTTAEKVNQKMIRVDQGDKTALVTQLIADNDWSQVLIFTRTKYGADRLCRKLSKKKITAAAIHGNKTQNARTRALKEFKNNKVRVLVATDIAARGLDIPLLPHVINFELPNVPEDYVHRIGRTGRAGASGEALSLVSIDEVDYLKSIERLLDQKLPTETIEGFEPTDKPAIKKKNTGKKQYGRPKFHGEKKKGGPKRKSKRR